MTIATQNLGDFRIGIKMGMAAIIKDELNMTETLGTKTMHSRRKLFMNLMNH